MHTVFLRVQRAQFHTVKRVIHSFIHCMLNFRYTKQWELSVYPQKWILSSEETKRDNNYGSKWESVCNKISPGLTVLCASSLRIPTLRPKHFLSHQTHAATPPVGQSLPCHPTRAASVTKAVHTVPPHLYYPRPSSLVQNLLSQDQPTVCGRLRGYNPLLFVFHHVVDPEEILQNLVK